MFCLKISATIQVAVDSHEIVRNSLNSKTNDLHNDLPRKLQDYRASVHTFFTLLSNELFARAECMSQK